jgi:hypothetical protein
VQGIENDLSFRPECIRRPQHGTNINFVISTGVRRAQRGVRSGETRVLNSLAAKAQPRFRPHTPLQWANVWWPSLINFAIVANESTDRFSAEHTRHLFYHWFSAHIMAVNWETWGLINWELRKFGHFTGYGVICLIFYTCWTRTLLPHVEETFARLRRRRALGAIVSTFLLASLDEFHQTFIPSRTGSFHDVVTDTVGGFFALVIWYGLQAFFSRIDRPHGYTSHEGQAE